MNSDAVILLGLLGALALLFLGGWALDRWRLYRRTTLRGEGLYRLAYDLGLEPIPGETDRQLRARCVELLKAVPGRPS